MSDYNAEISVVEAAGFFNLSPSALTVSGPMQDLSLQITFADDFVQTSKMRIAGTSLPQTVGLTDVKVSFDSEPIRLAYGRVKLSLASAKELVRLLQEHIERTEQVLKTLQPEAEK